jgi:hypothetical protein
LKPRPRPAQRPPAAAGRVRNARPAGPGRGGPMPATQIITRPAQV